MSFGGGRSNLPKKVMTIIDLVHHQRHHVSCWFAEEIVVTSNSCHACLHVRVVQLRIRRLHCNNGHSKATSGLLHGHEPRRPPRLHDHVVVLHSGMLGVPLLMCNRTSARPSMARANSPRAPRPGAPDRDAPLVLCQYMVLPHHSPDVGCRNRHPSSDRTEYYRYELHFNSCICTIYVCTHRRAHTMRWEDASRPPSKRHPLCCAPRSACPR